jgi:predicted TIM-barrel fold metal-dependent hydrolase
VDGERVVADDDLGALTDGAMAGPWGWVRERIPPGTEVFDAHVHIGADLDGRAMTSDGVARRMEAAGVVRSIVFALNDPNARDDYSGPNDVVWRAYEERPDLFVPFFRLNPHHDYEEEFARCVGLGFRGMKLHPLSQRFELDAPRAVRLFEMAAEAGLPVIIHAGHGMRRIVEPLLPTLERLGERFRLILGHSAMVEVPLAARAFAPFENVLFETSVVRARDLYVLFRLVEPHRICFGSDVPYGDLHSTLFSTVAAADAAGLSDGELSGVLSGNIRRWFS